jgi:hypothetical protein
MKIECDGPEYDSENYVIVECMDCQNVQHEPKKYRDKIGWGCRRCGNVHETNLQTGVTERHALSSQCGKYWGRCFGMPRIQGFK